ncbi:MAG: hypothetical protein CMK07_00220 [Ponticaulis sp.]|nr:hypothetical protein [Ponticaulis sp.]
MTEVVAKNRLSGWHVLMWILGFFGLMFIVNGVFLYNAITSFPGEYTKKSYVQGLNYNDTLEERSEQAARGWSTEMGFQHDRLIVRLQDENGYPLVHRDIVAVLKRSATEDQDALVTLTETSPGEYAASVDGLAGGIWRAEITVVAENDEPSDFVAYKTLTR